MWPLHDGKTAVRIGMVLKGKIPPADIRVEKEAMTLMSEGHEVHLLLERGAGDKEIENVGGIDFFRGIKMGRVRETWHRYTFSFTFRDPMWRNAIRDFAISRRIEVLHVHDLPLVGEAVAVADELGIPVVADMHENYPGGLQVWYTSRFKKKTIYNFKRWARYEREILGRADAVVIASQSASLADAAATAIANTVTTTEDVPKGIRLAESTDGLIGAVIVKDDRIGVFGELPIRRIRSA